METPWSEQVCPGDVPPDFEEMRKREDRKERIKPYWALLVEDQEPKVNKQVLLLLMQDLKEEGNALFKEEDFGVAWMHYRNALFVARVLEMRFYHDVDKEFISTLFSNRAQCCLKKEMYQEAAQDCESAIQIFPTNLKAYYRQAVAYKHQKKYKEAIEVAKSGQKIQAVAVLKELIDELSPLVDDQQKQKPVAVSAKFGEPLPSFSDVPDSDWLAGTNFVVTEKHKTISKTKMPAKKGKPKGSKLSSKQSSQTSLIEQNNVSSLESSTQPDSDSSESSIGEDDEKFASSFQSVRRQQVPVKPNDVLHIVRPHVTEEEKAWSFPHDSDGNVMKDADDFHIPGAIGTRTATGSMGLDQFSPTEVGSESPFSLSSTSSGRSSRASQSPIKVNTGPYSTMISKPQGFFTKRGIRDPTPPQNQVPPELQNLKFPLIDEFDFKLACRHCFVKIGEGAKGYRYVLASHTCLRDVLIIKNRSKAGINWVKIRPRVEARNSFGGPYKICQQFSQGFPCKVGEEKCTFPHHQPELKLWTMDRMGEFNINRFIKICKDNEIETSDILRSLTVNVTEQKSQHIPGLNYADDKKSKTKSIPSEAVKKPQQQVQEPIKTSTLTSHLSKSLTMLTNTSLSMPPSAIPAPSMMAGIRAPASNVMSRPPAPQTSPNIRPMPPQQNTIRLPPPPVQVFPRPFPQMPQVMRPNVPTYPQNIQRNRFPGPFNFPPPPLQSQPGIYTTPMQPSFAYPIPQPTSADNQPQDMQQERRTKLENPLMNTHEFRVVCQHCFRRSTIPGVYEYRPCTHKCEENILAMSRRDNPGVWFQVRERKNHRDFTGNYILCHSVSYNNPSLCRYGEDLCSFAHNEIEQRLWTLEKDGHFDITEFIMQNRNQSMIKGFSLREILDKHCGYFELICKACYYSKPCKVSIEGSGNMCTGKPPHKWTDFSILAHLGATRVLTVVNPRGFLHKTAFFKICKWLHYCRNRINAECRFAHSMVERDIWMLERDTNMKREDIVKQSQQLQGINKQGPPPQNVGPQRFTPSPASSMHSASSMSDLSGSSSGAKIPGQQSNHAGSEDLCPFVVNEVCGTCWTKGLLSFQDSSKDRCQKSHANWIRNKIYLHSPSNKEVRPLPRKVPAGFNFIVCKYVRERNKCQYTGGGPCQFAHSNEELEVWKWMCINNVSSLETLAEVSRESQKIRAAATKAKISGESVVSVSRQGSMFTGRMAVPIGGQTNTYYCHYCGLSCNSQKQWDEHCASERHTFNVNSDKEHQWNYRQPPWGIPLRSYELCGKHEDGFKCQYSHVPEMYNLCRYAHSQEELDEWRERYEWRQMKREMARQEKVFSYMDQLLEKYENSDSSVKVISESLDGVQITSPKELNIYREEKNATYTWVFIISSQLTMLRAALLYNRDRLHFSLRSPSTTEKSCQIAPGEVFEDVDDSGMPCYRVTVQFTGGMYGSFQQWVIFDFDTEPVVCRKLTVEVGTQSSHEKVRHLRETLTFDRWTSLNREIVRYDSDATYPYEEKLLRQYKEPASSESVVTQQVVLTELNRHNYVPKMHKLLELEEITRHQIISSYNLCATIEVVDVINDDGMICAHPGELFARVPLQENLTEDTDAGKLILTSVRKVLLAPQNQSEKVVFEACIVREDNFNYDGRGRDYIYLCLSPSCVRRLNLKAKDVLTIELQFQMNRLFFCRMHFAIDQLNNTEIVFPDVPKINPLRNERHILKVSSSVLNEDQMKAVRHIVAERSGYTPPFIMYGPFGTGKTETIAQAAMVLLKEQPTSKILICAQSNSAADLYITKHFDIFIKKSNITVSLRRVYYKERRVYTVAPEVKKYCILSPDSSYFESPTKEDILSHRIVIVTLAESLVLTSMGLQGNFTHIFIDEAAQSLECETIMPISLANENTCIVLAGDHMQISPKVYSAEARNQKLHMSLLERLYNYYDSHSNLISPESPLNILLSINYRTKMEILRFIAATFYGGPDKLISRSNIPAVVEITPLTFYGVQGREVQDSDSVSYYNMSEVQEIVERVEELFKNWPEAWGERSAKEIGVVTPYYDQVQLIRKALKKKYLRDVTVERISNVQGKEFRALYISTVRTRHLIEASHVQNTGLTECDGESGDFGFLSDCKLLNTALTRAQSLVVVVGDPVALCAIGECVNVWRVYLKHCQNMNSLYPPNLTLDSIKQQVQNLLNSPARERLLQVANQRQQAVRHVPARDAPAEASTSDVWTRNQNISKLNGLPSVATKEPPAGNGASSQKVAMNAEEIMIQLVRMAKQGVVNGNGSGMEIPVRVDCIKIHENAGHAILWYTQVDGPVPHEDEVRESNVYVNYTEGELQEFIKHNPDKYKRCLIHIDSFTNMYAEVLDKVSPFSEIQLNNRARCGQAFDNDEAVVEVLDTTEETPERWNTNSTSVQGQVIGVLKRFVDPNNHLFLCIVESGSTGRMLPLNQGIPPIYNLVTKSSLQRAKRGNVCVYKLTTTSVNLSHFDKIDPVNPTSRLYVVQYLQWEPCLESPVGIVIGVLPAGDTINSGMQILNRVHYVEQNFSPALYAEVGRLYPVSYQLPASVISSRVDLRNDWTFTIDSPSAEDLATAFSISQKEDGCYLIGVHISDVAYFVPKNSCIDQEAINRGISLYPMNHEPIHMLPPRLSKDLCSLKPNVDHLTLSILMTVQHSGEITDVQPTKGIIQSKRRFTYQEAEDILQDPNAQNDYLKSCILCLYQIAMIWRKVRLGNAYIYHDMDNEAGLTPASHQLVQEIKIMTDHQVAQLILQAFPSCTPLCHQSPPNEEKLDEWKQKFAADAVNSIALTKPFLEDMAVCNCRLACTCIATFIKRRNIKVRDTFDIDSYLWETLVQASDSADFYHVQNIIVEVKNHPQLTVAQLNLRGIQSCSKYACSGSISDKEQSHYSINLSPFTHFTSPLHRYFDIVTQRFLTAYLDSRPAPYSETDVHKICFNLTGFFTTARLYENEVHSLNLSSALRARPLVVNAVVDSVTNGALKVLFPTVPDIPSSQRSIPLEHLCPSNVVVKSVDSISLKWHQRVYDLQHAQSATLYQSSHSGVLNPDRFILKIHAYHWQKFLMAIRESNLEKLSSAVALVKNNVKNPASGANYVNDISSDVLVDGKIKHRSEFSMDIHQSSVIQVQVSAQMYKGILIPMLQLLNLTPRLSVCLEHRRNPVHCFAYKSISQVTSTYLDEKTYQSGWLPLINMEAACAAVLYGESVIIHNVNIEWGVQQLDNGATHIASLVLPISFLKERQIKFSHEISLEELFHPSNSDLLASYFMDYCCVRYDGLQLPDDPVLNDSIAVIVNNGVPVCWVGHCMITSVSQFNGGKLKIIMQLNQSSVPLPQQLLLSMGGKDLSCTLELIMKTPHDRNVDYALRSLTKASSLAKDIAVGRNPVANVTYKDEEDLMKLPTSLPLCNPNQEQALLAALTEPFTLINGPPGTGKSMMAARLGYMFTQRNNKSYTGIGSKPQVLICAPTNKCLDVLSGYLLSLGVNSPDIVRVYGEQIEQEEYPLPGDSVHTESKISAQRTEVDMRYIDISLHHLIRHPSNPSSKSIEEHDTLFSLYPDDIAEDQVAEYVQTIKGAEMDVLSKAEIIITTCSNTASPRFQGCNVQQIIIDDAGMCTEPESMIPISLLSNAVQIILLGDPKQFKPIVKVQSASDLGLSKSLFDRYADRAIVLSKQYRMHQGICEFLSNILYEGNLKAAIPPQMQLAELNIWPNGSSKPVVFCNLIGMEEVTESSYSQDKEHIVKNTQESKLAVRIADMLVRCHSVRETSIVILVLQQAQCDDIQQRLQQQGYQNITASTALGAQGQEWDYVIFSTVRSQPKSEIERKPTGEWKKLNLGLLCDEHQVNVVLTRARKGLIIFGNKHLLQCENKIWKKLLTDYEKDGKVVEASVFLKHMEK
ncbi:hypothetical protein ACJMK2_035491 [Sinanodonta woodiana]|uniref:C3H1-type domain-containing protein n=1 Tax=Sinanodonta woodiana TaxID=1069815 RepID=A0ABD3WV50_SINWO